MAGLSSTKGPERPMGLRERIDALDRATRAPEPLEIVGDLRDAVLALLRDVDALPQALDRLTRDGPPIVIRTDHNLHAFGLVVIADQDNHLRAIIPDDGRAVLCDAVIDGAALSNSETPGSHRTNYPRRLRLAALARRLPQPVAFSFASPRVFDSVLQVLRYGALWQDAPPQSALVYREPGGTIADPLMLERLGVGLEPIDKARLKRCHVVARAPGLPMAPLRAVAERLLPRQSPHAHRLYVSLEVEKRSFVEQTEALARTIDALAAVNPDLAEIVVNGMTAPYDGAPGDFFDTVRAAEAALMAEIAERTSAAFTVTSLFGQTLNEKAAASRECAFFVAPTGSAALLPTLMGVPGVVYTNRARHGFMAGLDHPGVARVPVEMVSDRTDVSGALAYKWTRAERQTTGYSIDPAAFAAFVAAHARATLGPAG